MNLTGVLLRIPFAISLGDLNPVTLAGKLASNFGLSLITPWVLDGTKSALEEVARIINSATAPNVESAWFSSEYWRVAAIASLLTLPFIFAAALQALLRSDPGLLVKSVFGYLPLAAVGVSIATPLVMLLMSASDEMCAIVSGPGVDGGSSFLDRTANALGGMTALGGSPFFAVIVGLFTLAAALLLTVELLIREACVYVVVLMLPLAFAALVWPARRMLATRLVELLISLILAKFVIVSVLSLAGAAVGSGHGVAPLLTAMSLVLLSTFAPWALMRLLPFTEVAAAAAGSLRSEAIRPVQEYSSLDAARKRMFGPDDEPDALAITGPVRLDEFSDDVLGGETGRSSGAEGTAGAGAGTGATPALLPGAGGGDGVAGPDGGSGSGPGAGPPGGGAVGGAAGTAAGVVGGGGLGGGGSGSGRPSLVSDAEAAGVGGIQDPAPGLPATDAATGAEDGVDAAPGDARDDIDPVFFADNLSLPPLGSESPDFSAPQWRDPSGGAAPAPEAPGGLAPSDPATGGPAAGDPAPGASADADAGDA